MVEEQKNHREEEKLLPFWCSSSCSWISQENIHPTEKKYKEKCLNMVEEQKSQRSKKVVTFVVFFTVFMNLRAKHSSISVVKYGRTTKKHRKVVTFFVFFVVLMNRKTSSNEKIQPRKIDLLAKHSSNRNTTKISRYESKTFICRDEKTQKSCYLFFVFFIVLVDLTAKHP